MVFDKENILDVVVGEDGVDLYTAKITKRAGKKNVPQQVCLFRTMISTKGKGMSNVSQGCITLKDGGGD